MKDLTEVLKELLEDMGAVGEDNAVTAKEIDELMGIKGERLRAIVNNLRQEGFPICSSRKGYFIARAKDDVIKTITQLNNRIKGMQNATAGLLKYLVVEE